MKRITIALLALVFMLAGCGEKKEKKTQEAAPAAIKVTEGAVQKQEEATNKQNSGEFYYSYNKEKRAQKSEVKDEGRFTRLGAYRHVLNKYQKVQIALWANKLSKDFLIYCSACHDDYANGVIGPSLLDKSGEYIYKQLQEFKSGKRKNVLMVQLVRRLSDEQLKSLANEIATFNKKVQKLLQEHQKDTK